MLVLKIGTNPVVLVVVILCNHLIAPIPSVYSSSISWDFPEEITLFCIMF